jgi:hypothetical protein
MFPSVYCFRITDIKKEAKNKFTFEFEVLNWTDTPATDLELALNTATSRNVSLGGAGVDPNGRPIGPGDDGGPPGNQNKINDWSVTGSSPTFAQWDAGTPIPNFDLLSGAVPPWFTPSGSKNPVPESIDDGRNVLDGFTVTVNNFRKGNFLSFNWGLTNNGRLIASPYGSGVVSLARFGNGLPGPLFNQGGQPFGTGFNRGSQTPNLFSDQIDPSLLNEFGLSPAGGGSFAPFKDPDDGNRMCGNSCNTDLTPRPQAVPEPGNIGALGLLGLGLSGYRWKQRKQHRENIK